MVNKKGSVLMYGIMVGLTIIILALALAKPVNEQVQSARNESSGDNIGLNCSTTTDSFVKATCVATDISPFWFIIGLILIGGGFLGAKIILS